MLNRLLIVSFNLKERATGKSFDEVASDAEIKESILYDSAPTTDEDSVLFWGLCSALYHTFSPDDGSTVIQLETETLILFPLEDDVVVAIARLSKNMPETETRSPSHNTVVVWNLRRSHKLFCLLRDGGIIPRIDDNESLQKLYDLHKLVRTSPDAQTELDSFRSQLALSRLREELSIHYDTFMTEPLSNIDCSFGLVPPIQYLPRFDHAGGTAEETYHLLEQTLLQARDSDDSIVDILAVNNNATIIPTKERPDLTAKEAPILQAYLLQIRESFSMLPSLASNYFVVPAASPVTNMTPGFLPPPPLANLSSLDTVVEEVRIPSENSDDDEMSTAWAPRVYLGPDEQYRVMLFDTNILVFIREGCETLRGSPTVVSHLKKASDLLGNICSENYDVLPCTTSNERVDCTLLPNDDVWIYQSNARNVVLDAAKCKNLADVQRAISM